MKHLKNTPNTLDLIENAFDLLDVHNIEFGRYAYEILVMLKECKDEARSEILFHLYLFFGELSGEKGDKLAERL